jgi:hypothetical protein
MVVSERFEAGGSSVEATFSRKVELQNPVPWEGAGIGRTSACFYGSAPFSLQRKKQKLWKDYLGQRIDRYYLSLERC